MGWFRRFTGNAGANPDAQARAAEWMSALGRSDLPGFVKTRLEETAQMRRPWVSTSAPGSLLAQRLRGIRPLGLVSGNCWFQYGYSWTEGHYEGWKTAISRLQQEATLMGANAVVDVRMRIRRMAGEGNGDHMDYGVLGTAVKLDGLPESLDPAIATVSALEFVRLLEAGIVPVGVAIGAQYRWLSSGMGMSVGPGGFGVNIGPGGMGVSGGISMGTGMGAGLGMGTFWNQEWIELSKLAEQVRRQAIAEMRRDGLRMGSGVLAHTQHTEILGFPANADYSYPRFLARHIAMGTAILHDERTRKKMGVTPVMSAADSRRLMPDDNTKEVI